MPHVPPLRVDIAILLLLLAAAALALVVLRTRRQRRRPPRGIHVDLVGRGPPDR
jgi:hypothetical protein